MSACPCNAGNATMMPLLDVVIFIPPFNAVRTTGLPLIADGPAFAPAVSVNTAVRPLAS